VRSNPHVRQWRRNGAPERIRTSDPQIRRLGVLLFSHTFFVNRVPHLPIRINDLPVGCKPDRGKRPLIIALRCGLTAV